MPRKSVASITNLYIGSLWRCTIKVWRTFTTDTRIATNMSGTVAPIYNFLFIFRFENKLRILIIQVGKEMLTIKSKDGAEFNLLLELLRGEH